MTIFEMVVLLVVFSLMLSGEEVATFHLDITLLIIKLNLNINSVTFIVYTVTIFFP